VAAGSLERVDASGWDDDRDVVRGETHGPVAVVREVVVVGAEQNAVGQVGGGTTCPRFAAVVGATLDAATDNKERTFDYLEGLRQVAMTRPLGATLPGVHEDEPTGSEATTWATQGIPEDAQRLGLDRNTIEGSMLAMAGTLSSSRASHRWVAWLLLVVLVTPALLSAVAWLGWS